MPDTQTDAWGIDHRWVDAFDEPQTVSDETVAGLRAAIGTPPADLEDRAPVVTRPGRRLGLGRVTVVCEDGTRHEVDDALPEDFPLGYHWLERPDGTPRRLIVSPGRCWLPEGGRAWGWTVQLYGVHSRTSLGMGDLSDLRSLREWTERLGGGFLLVNPLHAVAPSVPQETSPYLPATRRFRNPIYLDVREVPGVDLDAVERAHAELAKAELVDRDAVWTAKSALLRDVFGSSDAATDDEFIEWRRGQGSSLNEYVTWCALTERHGPDWRTWPEDLRRPDSDAVVAFAAENPHDLAFHAWLQYLLDRQLTAASAEMTVIQDLPIGVAGGGADAWAWQDVLAGGTTVGAPPDLFNTLGQDWGSPPLVPWRLRLADYEPFIESIRGTIAGAGGLRIDHVMGLFRLWWVPDSASPAEGAYVRYPSEELLDIVALESHRAKAVVVGEDLGTVEPGVRETLAEYGVLAYRLLWFEEGEPSTWPEQALAAVTTHDLPTVAGLWSGADMDDVLATTDMDRSDVQQGREDLLARLDRGGVLGEMSTTQDAVRAAYRQLAEAPSLLLSVSLEDAVGEERRPNVPGTVVRDNWRIPLRLSLEELTESEQANDLAALMNEAVRSPER